MSATVSEVRAALDTVMDPELGRPITDLDMVRSLSVADGVVEVTVLLTIAGCPLRERIVDDVTVAARRVPGVTDVHVTVGVMDDEQRAALRGRLSGGTMGSAAPSASALFSGARTRVYAVASGKGGVGKSTITVNLAAALAARGLHVGLLDADIYGFSVPRMMGVTGRPTQVGNLIVPPTAYGVKVISAGMFVQGNAAIAWRGPLLHRALQQFLSDVYWDEPDVLLLDLPPGTGDIALSTAQLVPTAELIVVTTPQTAAAEVAERAGSLAAQTHQRITGVIENMSGITLADGTRLDVFGRGGGQVLARSLSAITGREVPLLGEVPLDGELCESGDAGMPAVLGAPQLPAARALIAIAEGLVTTTRSLVGRSLGLTPVAAHAG